MMEHNLQVGLSFTLGLVTACYNGGMGPKAKVGALIVHLRFTTYRFLVIIDIWNL